MRNGLAGPRPYRYCRLAGWQRETVIANEEMQHFCALTQMDRGEPISEFTVGWLRERERVAKER